MQTSTLKVDESGEPLHIQQAAQIRAFREAWKEMGNRRTSRISVSRSIFVLLDNRDRGYFGRGSREEEDKTCFEILRPRVEAGEKEAELMGC